MSPRMTRSSLIRSLSAPTRLATTTRPDERICPGLTIVGFAVPMSMSNNEIDHADASAKASPRILRGAAARESGLHEGAADIDLILIVERFFEIVHVTEVR